METINTVEQIETTFNKALKWELGSNNDLKSFLTDNNLYDEYLDEMRKEPNWVGKITKVLYNLARIIDTRKKYKKIKEKMLLIKTSSLNNLKEELNA